MKDTAGRAGGILDYSPNNHGFAMADRHGRANVRKPANSRQSTIDNNPTPSYLSLGVGYLLFADAFRVEFARKVPHSGTPEANPAVAA
jgi:hypothetical protein